MPTRLVDGDRIADSDKLARCRPGFAIHYAYLLTLALANGSFEADAKRIAHVYYSKHSPFVTADQVAEILDDFERVKALFRWKARDGKTWGYFPQIHKRLPAVSKVKKGHYLLGEPVPIRELAKFLGRPCKEIAKELQGRIGRTGGKDVRTLSGRGADEVRLGLGLDLDRKGKGLGASRRKKPAPSGPASSSPPSSSLASLAPPSPAPPPSAQTEREGEEAKGNRPPKKMAGSDSFFSDPEKPMRFDDAPQLEEKK